MCVCVCVCVCVSEIKKIPRCGQLKFIRGCDSLQVLSKT
jgi:hypothetical protein